MIWVTPERLARCKQERDLDTERWRVFDAVCREGLTFPMPYDVSNPKPYGIGFEVNFALHYKVSGQTTMRDRAIHIALQRCAAGMMAMDHDRTGYAHYGGARHVVPAVAPVYDWLYDRLSQSQRDTMETWLLKWGQTAWPETQPQGGHTIDTWARQNPGDNFYVGAMLAGWVPCRVLRPLTNERVVLEGRCNARWGTQFLPYKSEFEPDGFPREGTSYGLEAWGQIALLVDAVRTTTGQEIYPEMADRLATYLYHATTPDMTRVHLFGENARIEAGPYTPLMPIDSYARMAALIAADQADTPATKWLTHWLQTAVTPRAQEWQKRTDRFRWYAWQELLFGSATPRLSMSVYVKPAQPMVSGFFVDHSRKTGTQVTLEAGRPMQSHQSKAAGAITIYKDGHYLIGSANMWGRVPPRETESHSTLSLPPMQQSEGVWAETDQPQGLKDAQAEVRITRHEETQMYTYVSAECAGAYAYKGAWKQELNGFEIIRPLRRWTRHVLWHREKDLILLLDEINTSPGCPDASLLFHALGGMMLKDGWMVAAGDNRLYYTVFDAPAMTSEQYGPSTRIAVTPRNPLGCVQALAINRADATRYLEQGVQGVTWGSGDEAVTLAIQTGEMQEFVAKREWHLRNQHTGASRAYNSAEKWQVAAVEALAESQPDTFYASWITETRGGIPNPPGEFILIRKEE